MLNPRVYKEAERLQKGLTGSFLLVEDAFERNLAEELRQDLMDTQAWRPQSIVQPDFVYQRDKIDLGATNAPHSVNRLYDFLRSPETLRWIGDLSGRPCDTFHGAAAIFKPGDHISEHNDNFIYELSDRRAIRAVTFTYYLTQEWDASWGGRLIWKKPYTEIVPRFNTMVLFLVGPDSLHWVEPVNPSAPEPRLSITGWFLKTLPPPGHRIVRPRR